MLTELKSSRGLVGNRSKTLGTKKARALSLATMAVVAGIAGTAFAADTADNVNLNATTALDTAGNYSTTALPTTTNDMVFTNGIYTNTAFVLNTTALTPGTLDDLDTTQTISISGSKSITLKTLANGVLGSVPADLLYVGNGATFNSSASLIMGITGGNFDVVGTANITSSLNGSTGTFSLAKTGAGTLSLSAAEGYTGGTTLAGGTLNLNFAGSGAPATNILQSTGAMTWQFGTLNITGATSGTNSQTIGAVTLNNAGFVYVNTLPGTSGTAALTMASLTRNVNVNTDAAGGGIQFSTTGTTTITGTLSSAILADSQGNPFATYGTDNWAATNSTGGVIAAATSAYTDWTASAAINGLSTAATRFSNTGTQITITNSNTSTIRGVLVTSGSAGGTITGGNVRPNRVLTGGDQFLVVENAPANATPGGVGDLTIASSIAVGSSSTPTILVKAGPGRLVLTNATNSQTRDFIDGGILSVGADLDLGPTGGDLVFDGGSLEVTGSFTPATARATILNANSGITVTGSNSFTDQGFVSGSGSLTKSGTGTLVLSNANAFIGGTFINAGTLNINGFYALGGGVYGGTTLNGGTLQYVTNLAGVNSGAGNGGGDLSFFGNGFTVGAGGGTIDLNGNPVTYAGTLHDGGGALTIASTDGSHAGVLTLSGNSTLAGGITVSSGGLTVTGNLSTTPVNFNSTGVLNGTGSVGALNVSSGTVFPGVTALYINQLTTSSLTYSGGTFEFGVGTSLAGNISTGLATFNAKPAFTFSLSGAPVTGSVYPLINSTSAIVGTSNLTGLTASNIGRLILTPSLNGSNQIIVTVSGNAGNLIWGNNASTGMWNIQTDANWLNTNSNSVDQFYTSDNVTFNDSNGGGSNYTVSLATAVAPGSVNVNNSSGNYVFNGPGYITGGTSLIKSGSGMLTLNTVNNYSGGTIVNAGTLQLGVAGALLNTGAVTIQGTGTLDLDGNNQTVGSISDGGVSTGVITTTTGTPVLTIANSSPNTFSGTINGSTGITVAGSSSVTLSGVNSFTGYTNVSTGSLVVSSNSALGSSTSSTGGLITAAGTTTTFNTTAPVIASLAGTGGNVILANSGGATLTVGGGNQTTTFGGVLSDLSGTTSTAIGNLTVTGSGTLILSGANTFTGTTIVGGTGTLELNNSLALQNSTLNYNSQGGTLTFGTITAATVAGLNGSQNLTLNNASSAGVTLTVGNSSNLSSGYSGVLSGAGSLITLGGGTFNLSGANTYTGFTNEGVGGVNNPGTTLNLTGTIGAGAIPGVVTVNPGATLNINGGSIIASGFTVNQKGGFTTVNLTNNATINVSTGTVTLGSDSGASGFNLNVDSGTVTADIMHVGRNFASTATLITSETNAGALNINGSNAVVNVTTTLGIGDFTNANSDSIVQVIQGTLNVGGLTTITQNNTRTSVLDVAGGTFNGPAGVQIGGVYTAPFAEFMVHGGTANVGGIAFGTSATTGGSTVLELGGGTLYIDAGGMVNNSSGGAVIPTINFGSTAFATAPTLAASAAWSSPLAMTLTNSSAGLTSTIQTANSSGAAENITLTGKLSGTGGLTKTGAGVLVLNNSANNYSGATNLSAGTIVDVQNTTLTSTSSLNINGNMIVQNSPSLSQITKQVAEGFNAGTWNGTSSASGIPITSSSAASDAKHLHALGVIQNDDGTGTITPLYTTFEGYSSLNDTDALIKYTYYGDANLDGKVDGSDYSRIDAGYLKEATESTPFSVGVTGWFNGDFNYDNVVNGSDYTLIDNAFNSQGAQISAEIATPTAQIAGSGASSAVPEPTTLGLLGIGAVGLLGRRSRRRSV